jgi:glycosyltransferase involved in cell wall biosynthesis
MTDKKNTTVVIPVFNASKYIYRTALSILSNRKVGQIILVNDCSTDNTPEIIEKIKKSDNRVLVLSTEKNSGAGHARNIAIPHIEEYYCCFIDADDIVIDNGIDEVTEILNVYGGDFLVYKWFQCDMYGRTISLSMADTDEHIWNGIIHDERITKIHPEEYPHIMRTLNFPWNKIYKTSFIKEKNIIFSETFIHNDNLAHWMSYAQTSEIILYNRYIIGHKEDRRRVQISTIMDKRRLQLFDAFHDIDIFFEYGEKFSNIYPHFVCYKRDLIGWFGHQVKDNIISKFYENTINTFSNMSSELFSKIKEIDPIAARDILIMMTHPNVFFKRNI